MDNKNLVTNPQTSNNESRSEKLQKIVVSCVGEDFFTDIAKQDSDGLFSTNERYLEAQKELERIKVDVYYKDSACSFDASHICAKVFGRWAKSHGCKYDSSHGVWAGAAVSNIERFIFADKAQSVPTKGVIRNNTPIEITPCLVDTIARAASWYAWVVDVHKCVTDSTKKARASVADKAIVYVQRGRNYGLSLSRAIKRASRNFKIDEGSLREYFAKEIRKAREVNRIKLANNQKKQANK